MRNTGIYYVQNFIMGMLLLKLLNHSAGNIDDLDDYLVVHFT